MSETNAAVQVRLAHEATTARVFATIQDKLVCPVTLITFDFGPVGEFSSVAFKTALPLPLLVSSIETLLEWWSRIGPRVIDRDEALRIGLPSGDELVALGNEVGTSIGEGRGYALLLGAGDATQYMALARREDMVKLLQDELLPHWRESGATPA